MVFQTCMGAVVMHVVIFMLLMAGSYAAGYSNGGSDMRRSYMKLWVDLRDWSRELEKRDGRIKP